MTDPAITAALNKLIANTPPPVAARLPEPLHHNQKDQTMSRSTGTTATTDTHFPRRMCLGPCCTVVFLEEIDEGFARAAAAFARAVA